MSDTVISWKWTRRFSVGLSISVAAFCGWGALAPHIPMAASMAPVATGVLMAALYGNSQALANCMAANARRAWERGSGCHLPALFFTGCFVGFALLSMSGLHSAWEYAKAHADGAPLPDDGLMRALFFFVAISEPAMNYGVEALKMLQKAEERAEEREAMDAAAQREARQRDAEARRKALFAVAAPAAAVAMVAAPGTQAEPVGARDLPFASISHSTTAGPELMSAAPVDMRVSDESESRPSELSSHSASAADPRMTMGTPTGSHSASGSGQELPGLLARHGPRDRERWIRFLEAHERGLCGADIIRETGLPSSTVYRWKSAVAAAGPVGA